MASAIENEQDGDTQRARGANIQPQAGKVKSYAQYNSCRRKSLSDQALSAKVPGVSYSV
jgi:hypothetical protein